MNLVLAFTNLSIVKSILLLTSIVKSIVLHTESDLTRHCFAWLGGLFLLTSQSFLSYSMPSGLIHTHTYILLFHVPWGFSLKYDKIRLVLRY